ncbi:Protein of unknown function [Propionibacterium freudenreichii]|nr:Protein of unknown function [Propionibacterium freudenreichii]
MHPGRRGVETRQAPSRCTATIAIRSSWPAPCDGRNEGTEVTTTVEGPASSRVSAAIRISSRLLVGRLVNAASSKRFGVMTCASGSACSRNSSSVPGAA